MLLATIDFSFLLLSSLVVILAWRLGVGIGATLHSIIFVLLVPGLQMMWRAESETQYEVAVYVAAHLVAVTYLVLFNLGVLWLRGSRVSDYPLVVTIVTIKDSLWHGTLVLWIAWQAYLIGKYGIVNLYVFKAYSAGAGTGYDLTYFDQVASSMLTTLALGAVLVYLTKLVSIRGYRFGFVRLTLVGVFLCTFLVFGGATLGVRRTVLFLALFALIVHVVLRRGHMFHWFRQKWRHVFLAVISVWTFAIYYQKIRVNFDDPEIAGLILSGSPREQFVGAMRYAIPQAEPPAGESAAMLRLGPFDLIYGLVETDQTLWGDLLWLSIQTVVPRLVMPNKPDVNVDEMIADRLGVVPPGDYLVPDLSTSVLAVFIADFGYGGVILAAGLMAVALVLLTRVIPRAKHHPLVLLGVLAMWFQQAANVEGDIVAVLAGLRDVLLLVLIVLPLDWVIRAAKLAARKAAVARHVASKRP